MAPRASDAQGGGFVGGEECNDGSGMGDWDVSCFALFRDAEGGSKGERADAGATTSRREHGEEERRSGESGSRTPSDGPGACGSLRWVYCAGEITLRLMSMHGSSSRSGSC